MTLVVVDMMLLFKGTDVPVCKVIRGILIILTKCGGDAGFLSHLYSPDSLDF